MLAMSEKMYKTAVSSRNTNIDRAKNESRKEKTTQVRVKTYKASSWIPQSCLGKLMNSHHLHSLHLLSERHKHCSVSLLKIVELLKCQSSQQHDTWNCLTVNGTISSADELWTSTRSSATWLPLGETPSISNTLWDLDSRWNPALLSAKSKLLETGLLLREKHPQQLLLSFHTDTLSYKPMVTISLSCLE